jgi:hypothetical protein
MGLADYIQGRKKTLSDADVQNLLSRCAELEQRQEEVTLREERITQREHLLAARDKEQIARETLVSQRERDVSMKEAEAKAGFAQANADALKDFLDTRTAAIDSRERMVKAAEESLIGQLKALENQKGECAARFREVQEREARCEAGLADQKLAMVKVVDQEAERLKVFARTLAEREAQCLSRTVQLESQGAELASRERAVIEREAVAEAGFHQRNKASVAALEAELTELRSERELLSKRLVDDERSARHALEGVVRDERQKRLGELDREIAGLREQHQAGLAVLESELASARRKMTETQEALMALESELIAERARKLQETQSELQKAAVLQTAELAAFLNVQRENTRRILEGDRQAFNAEVTRQRADYEQRAVELNERALECEKREFQIAQKEAVLDEERAAIEDRVKRGASAAVAARDAEVVSLKRSRDALLGENKSLHERVLSSDELLRRCGNRTPEDVLADLKRSEERIAQLEQELVDRPKLNAVEQIAALRRKSEELTAALGESRAQCAEFQAQKTKWVLSVSELENQKQLREAQERHRDALKLEVDALSEEVRRLSAIYEKPQELDARRCAIDAPHVSPRVEPKAETQDENQWLSGISERCGRSGLRFPIRLFHSFHTALKTAEWSPLAVLAGVSGTGKSELPRLYARFGGLNFLSVAVQPNWDSPQSLFGFFNSVDNRFNAMPALQFLAQSQRDASDGQGLRDQVCLILLDEMNLAPIELYFSDLLSKLEERRGLETPPCLEVDLGAVVEKGKVQLGRNVLWCGTMNEDETTKTLSDKVLDRGNILFFPRPKELFSRRRPQLEDPVSPLPLSVWRHWLSRAVRFEDEETREYRETLQKMNDYLEVAGRALGHRVWQTVEQYMGNYPDVINSSAERAGEKFKDACNRAFEDQLVLKVMPKLRGLETSGRLREECIEPIRAIIDEKAPALSEDFSLACQLGYGNFVWKSARYVEAGG